MRNKNTCNEHEWTHDESLRQADGKALMRSSVREFLASEALHHLGVSLDWNTWWNTFEHPESTRNVWILFPESHEIQWHVETKWKYDKDNIKTTSNVESLFGSWAWSLNAQTDSNLSINSAWGPVLVRCLWSPLESKSFVKSWGPRSQERSWLGEIGEQSFKTLFFTLFFYTFLVIKHRNLFGPLFSDFHWSKCHYCFPARILGTSRWFLRTLICMDLMDHNGPVPGLPRGSLFYSLRPLRTLWIQGWLRLVASACDTYLAEVWLLLTDWLCAVWRGGYDTHAFGIFRDSWSIFSK